MDYKTLDNPEELAKHSYRELLEFAMSLLKSEKDKMQEQKKNLIEALRGKTADRNELVQKDRNILVELYAKELLTKG